MGFEGPVEEGGNPVAMALFDDQIPIHSFGNQRLQFGPFSGSTPAQQIRRSMTSEGIVIIGQDGRGKQ